MAMTMKEKSANTHVKTEWPAALKTEFAREAERPNGCVGSELLSETDTTRVWMIRLAAGERIGFHRHVLNYFWTSGNGGPRRPHLMDGPTGGSSSAEARRASHYPVDGASGASGMDPSRPIKLRIQSLS